MQFSISNQVTLNGIPSGSGIVIANDSYYIIGDDSPTLFVLNKNLEVIQKILLQDTNLADGKRIPKPLKADYEALELIDENELVVFGSGSKSPQRDVFIRVQIGDEPKTETYIITEFYSYVKSLEIFSDSELNIEAVAYRDGVLYLFNRTKNVILFFPYDAFLKYIQGASPLPSVQTRNITLPQLNGIEAGFSGAVALKHQSKILFTASVENTSNAYDDGEILGSFIGIMDITDGLSNTVVECCRIPETKHKLKVESIAIDHEGDDGKAQLILITDDDKGGSEIIKGVLSRS